MRRRTPCSEVSLPDRKAPAIPAGFPGWPDGKQFAFLLTHDVEGEKGIGRVEQLMALEANYGFRSSFNFRPIAKPSLPERLRLRLKEAGFENGIYVSGHDSSLSRSKASFTVGAAKIRRHVEDWGVSGFRSSLMQHKLAWLHSLGIEYDSSTFDGDPFMPASPGVGTIFPFWVPGPGTGGYVELPQTMRQNFSTISADEGLNAWKLKLDWIAEHGGMALLSTQPDDMCFGGEPQRHEYPVKYYESILSYVRERYFGRYWHGVPRDVARFYCAQVPPSSRNSRKRVCMVAYSHYDTDNRVRRYAEALVKRGDEVEVVALSDGQEANGAYELNGVKIWRIRGRGPRERNGLTYVWRWLRFCLCSSILVTRRHRLRPYDLIHVHNMPDFLAFVAWYPKLTGAKLILDIHDVMPELAQSKFGSKPRSLSVRLLKYIERVSAQFADHIIVSNHLWYKKFTARSAPESKCSTMINHVDRSIFYRRSRTRSDGKFIILFPGSFQYHQGLDVAIAAFSRIADRVPTAELHLYGKGDARESLIRQVASLGLGERIRFLGTRSLEEIAEIMANADMGVVPKRANTFGNEAYSTKIMEFMSVGVPVVVSRTMIDSLYFNDQVVRFFESGNPEDMANAMLDLIENPKTREAQVENASAYLESNDWSSKKSEYFELVDRLVVEPSVAGDRQADTSPVAGR